MNIAECLEHKWLSQDVKFMRAKRLSTEQHKRFLARRKWQVSVANTSSFQSDLTRGALVGPARACCCLPMRWVVTLLGGALI